jgi:putative membrane protein
VLLGAVGAGLKPAPTMSSKSFCHELNEYIFIEVKIYIVGAEAMPCPVEKITPIFQGEDTMKIIHYFFILILLVLGVTFAVLNAAPVTFHYYVGSRLMPLSLLMVLSFMVGVFFTFLLMILKILQLKAQKHGLKRQLKIAEKEVENLRVMPIKD